MRSKKDLFLQYKGVFSLLFYTSEIISFPDTYLPEYYAIIFSK